MTQFFSREALFIAGETLRSPAIAALKRTHRFAAISFENCYRSGLINTYETAVEVYVPRPGTLCTWLVHPYVYFVRGTIHETTSSDLGERSMTLD